MPPLRRIWKFCTAIAHYWGSLVTGGVFIGIVGTWQATGHPVKAWIYWTIAILALLISAFRAWNDQVDTVKLVTAENQDHYGRRAAAIENISSRLVDIEQHAFSFIIRDAYPNNPDHIAASNEINKEIIDFNSLIQKDLYLPQNIRDTLQTFIDIIAKHITNVAIFAPMQYQRPETIKERFAVIMDADKAFAHEIPTYRNKLLCQFRKILGTDSSRS